MRFVWLAVVLSACISVPPFHGPSDGGMDGDASPGPLAVRLIANAYRDGGEDNVATGTPGMSKTGYSIATTGIVDGDLVVFIANVDNGADAFWKLPTGFTEIVQRFYGTDGQVYVVAWKIAAAEPALYTGMYASTASSSAAATISLLAVTGYDPQKPIDTSVPTDHNLPTDPADVGSPGITVSADNSLLIFAAGADWSPSGGVNTFEAPTGFEPLTSIGDRNTHWEWTCQVISYKFQAQAGPTGALPSTLTAVSYNDSAMHIPGGGWDVLFGIPPRPQ